MVKSFDCGTLRFELADERSDADLCSLLRSNPIDSWVRVSLAREPSFFRAGSLYQDGLAVIARDGARDDEAAGMYELGVLPTHVDGRAETAGYLGGLRIAPDYRNKLRFVRAGFDSIAALGDGRIAGVRSWFTSIAEENTAAKRLLTAGVKGLPRYRDAGAMRTLAMSSRQKRRRDLLRPANPEDLPQIIGFYNRHAALYSYSPVLTEAWLASLAQSLPANKFLLLIDDQGIRGCVALWDQRSMKQTVIQGYRFPLNLFRVPYNLCARLRRRVELPAPGRQIAGAFLAFFALDAEYAHLAAHVTQDALSWLPADVDIGLVGFSAANPLCDLLVAALRPREYSSRIYAVEFSPQETPPAGLPAQPEIALL